MLREELALLFATRLFGCTCDLGGSGFGTAYLDSGESGTLFGSTKNGIKSNSNFMIKIKNMVSRILPTDL
jgi:hypothetical protein